MIDFTTQYQKKKYNETSHSQFDKYVSKMNYMHPSPEMQYPGQLMDMYRGGFGGNYNSKQLMHMQSQAVHDRINNLKKASKMAQRGEGTLEECLEYLETPPKPLPGMPEGVIGGQSTYSPYGSYRRF